MVGQDVGYCIVAQILVGVKRKQASGCIITLHYYIVISRDTAGNISGFCRLICFAYPLVGLVAARFLSCYLSMLPTSFFSHTVSLGIRIAFDPSRIMLKVTQLGEFECWILATGIHSLFCHFAIGSKLLYILGPGSSE